MSDHDEVRSDATDDGDAAPEPPVEETDESTREDDDRDEGEHERLSERITQQLAHQWALIRTEREERHHVPELVRTGPTNVRRAQVPWGLDLAAAWSWRMIVIVIAAAAILWTLRFFAVLTLPLIIALLITALCLPLVEWPSRLRVPRGLSALVVVVGGLGVVGLLLTYIGREIASEWSELAEQVAAGLESIRTWLTEGPLNASDSQIEQWLGAAEEAIRSRAQDEEFWLQITQFGSTVGQVVAAFFIALFATYFFLADGSRIWSWMIRLFPRAARATADSSGRVAWLSLTRFVRATVLVAAVDAIGIMIVATVLKVPFVVPIGVLVFLGGFIPLVGATVSGIVAVLVALVAQGPFTALLMLGGVVVVQQVESNVLQPFLMGRWVRLHPLGVLVGITAGVLVAGIAGALIAVPLVAAINAVVLHLAEHTEPGADPERQLAEDYEQLGAGSPRGDPDD